MKVLIACEFSGIVRDALITRGHDAWSCDLLPTEKEGPHIQDNVLKHLDEGWDLMIAHPPCTYLSYAGLKYWSDPGRKEKREEAMNFFLRLYNAPIMKVCIENPMGYPNTIFRKPDQIIHPYYFGDRQMKRTCLWLKNLPKLFHSKEDTLFWKKTFTETPSPNYIDRGGKKRYFTDSITGIRDGQRLRSITFTVVAQAMAEQWG